MATPLPDSVTDLASDAMVNLKSSNAWQLKNKVMEYAVDHSGAIIGGILTLVAGVFISRWVAEMVSRTLERKSIEPPVRMLVSRIVRLAVFCLSLVVALETLGFNMTALIAGISVAGVGLGFAMHGVLSNMVAGLAIIFTKPFRVGEYVELLGVQGQVVTIQLVSTTLQHYDNSRVVIPNHKLIGEVLHNYGMSRQLELSVGVGYGTDLAKAQSLIMEALKCNPRVLRDPTPVVIVSALSDSSITYAVKPWVKVNDYVSAQGELYQAIVERFRAANIEMPFPQREIRILNPTPVAGIK